MYENLSATDNILHEIWLRNRLLAVPQAALRNVPNLKRLSLSFNRIAVVSGELFASTPGLKQLSLSYNVIRELGEDSFQSLKSLRKLDLRGNQVKYLQFIIRQFNSLIGKLFISFCRAKNSKTYVFGFSCANGN